MVNGTNLGTDLTIQVNLVNSDAAVFLGEALCNGHGDFSQTYTLPPNLTPGVYTIQAIDTSVMGVTHIMASVSLQIVPPSSNRSAAAFLAADATAQPIIWVGLGILSAILLITTTTTWRRQPQNGAAPSRKPHSQF